MGDFKSDEELRDIDAIVEDATMTLSMAEEYFDGIAYKAEPTGPNGEYKELQAQAYNDDGTPGRTYKVELIITPL